LSINVKPYGYHDKSRKAEIAEMFDNIAPRYDFLNHLLSLGIDKYWRKKAVRKLQVNCPTLLLDIATGTGDFALEALIVKPEKVIGLDISPNMLSVGRIKIEKKGFTPVIDMILGESENLPFENSVADGVMVGFGARNFEDLDKGLQEICRVLKPGCKAVILEPSFPTKFPMNLLFKFYFKFILPTLGALISKDPKAYTYLPESVAAFPEGKKFTDRCLNAGFKTADYHPLTLGICALYVLEK